MQVGWEWDQAALPASPESLVIAAALASPSSVPCELCFLGHTQSLVQQAGSLSH